VSFLVDIVIPDTNDRDQEISSSNKGIKDEQQEESLVLKTNTIVDENAMTAHLENTSLADGAMMSSSWF